MCVCVRVCVCVCVCMFGESMCTGMSKHIHSLSLSLSLFLSFSQVLMGWYDYWADKYKVRNLCREREKGIIITIQEMRVGSSGVMVGFGGFWRYGCVCGVVSKQHMSTEKPVHMEREKYREGREREKKREGVEERRVVCTHGEACTERE